MERRSRFVYGTEEFVATISVRPWTPVDATLGGMRVAASGVPAGYVVRRDSLIDVTVRFWEGEWTALRNLLIWGQSQQVIDWYPDADDTSTTWPVYLEAPAVGDRIAPERDGEFPRVFELPLSLRGVGTAVPWISYFQLS